MDVGMTGSADAEVSFVSIHRELLKSLPDQAD